MTATAADLRALYGKLGPERYRATMRHACWEKHNLRYALHAGQRAAWAMVDRVHAAALASGGIKRALLNIARRWGKTFFFVVYVLTLMLRKPGARIPYAARSETSVREFVEPILLELASHAPPHLAPREYLGEWIIPASASKLHRGYVVPVERGTPEWRDRDSRLIVKGCEDKAKAERLRGPAADACVVDEAGFIPILSYVVQSVLAAQLTTTDGMMLVGSSAPETTDHEFWSLADEAQTHGAYMHATVYDAPHLSPRQIKSFAAEAGGEDSVAWQREGLSRRMTDPKLAVFPEWIEAELDHMIGKGAAVVGEIETPAHLDAYVVGDLGFADLTIVLFAYYHFERAQVVILDEVVTRRQTSDVIEAKVRATYATHFGDRRPLVRALEGDALVVASVRKEEKIARGEAVRGVPEDEQGEEPDPSRWNQIAFVQMEAAVNAARLRIKRRGVLVHPRCTTLIAHLRGAIWNEQRTEFVRVKATQTTEGHHFDGAAAFAYLVKKLQPNRAPEVPLPPHVHPYTHRIPEEMLTSGRVERARKAFVPKRERR